jgi:hypothetical protein
MALAGDFIIPDVEDGGTSTKPIIGATAEVVAALATHTGPPSPGCFAAALATAEVVGTTFGEPSLARLLILRALSAPRGWKEAIASLKREASALGSTERAIIMRALEGLLREAPRIGTGGELAGALGVPVPESLRRHAEVTRDASGGLAAKTLGVFRSEPPIVAEARRLALDFGGVDLLQAVGDARKTGDVSRLVPLLSAAVERIRHQMAIVRQTAEAQRALEATAQELTAAADQLEKVARQRHAAILRRAVMLKRHLRDDLVALAEDAAEEFEADIRRASEKKTWFGKLDTADLNERIVIKNLDRRYVHIARRYQEQLDLLEREVAEFCEEFTLIGDEALRPIARHEFRAVAPHPKLEKRFKAAVDRGTGRTLVAGTAGAIATGAALQCGLVTGAAVAGLAVTPVGALVLGVVAVSAVWKMFANPGERHRHDVRERIGQLEDRLREEVLSNLPRFELAVDAVITRFTSTAMPDIVGPRGEAERLREIAAAHLTLAEAIVSTAEARLESLLPLTQAS